MASLSTRAIDYSSISCYISGLSYPAKQYSYIYVTDVNCGTSGQISESRLDWSEAKQTFYPNTSSYNYAFTLTNGVKPNRSYTFYAYGKLSGKVWYIGRSSVTTPKKIVTPGTVSQIWQNSVSNSTLSIGWKAATNADSYEIKITNQKTGSPAYYETSSTNYYFRNLTAGVNYRIIIRAVNSGTYGSWSNEKYLYTLPNTPTLSVYETANEHIKIKVSMSGYWEFANIYCHETNQTVRVTPSDLYVRFYNLNKSTNYTFSAKAYVNTTLASEAAYISAKTSGLPRPQNFWWWSEKSAQSLKLDDVEFNTFTSRINEFRKYKNLSTVNFYTVSEGITFKAVHYNQAKNAINDMKATGLSDVSKGQSMTFANLATNLNKMVNVLNSIE